jgi:hypothetical protein
VSAEPFCEFGGLPVSGCAHCREQRRVAQYVVQRYAPAPLEAWSRELQAARWEKLHAIAFGPEHDFAALLEQALVGSWGPWMLAQWAGWCRCCGARIEEGDSVRYSEDERGLACLVCGSAEG